jgi:hypothetical protein
MLSAAYIAWHGHAHAAFAKGGDDDGGDDDEGGDDDGGGKGGGDDDSGDEEVDKDQPEVTAGGLFTKDTYPMRELSRPLTMTEGITQARVGLGTDISDKGAFESVGLSVEGVYGYSDNFTIRGGMTSAYNFHQYAMYFGFEGALAYDLIDFRTALRLSRAAAPEFQAFCSPTDPGDVMNPVDPMTDCKHMSGMPAMPDAKIVQLPNGKYHNGDTDFGIDLGFPFRYVAKPEIAIVALDTLMSINFTSKPDLLPSLGITTSPVAALNLLIFAQLRIPRFDFSGASIIIPATARVQFTPTAKFDLGLEFTFLNIKPPDPQKFYDSRFLSLFVQARM